MKERIDAYLFGPVAAARPFLLAKTLLLLLAFDAFVELVPHGGRYGFGGFNVAHFALLDRVGPAVTPALYVGTVLATGLLALGLALGRLHRVGVVALALLYTYGWAMSLLDAYQHHYLISLWLVSVACFPLGTSAEVFGSVRAPRPTERSAQSPRSSEARPRAEKARVRAAHEPRTTATTSAFGYVSFGLTTAIVYFFAAVSKLEPAFRDGSALRRVASRDAVAPALDLLFDLGCDEAEGWAVLARAAIVVQLATAVAFVLAPLADRVATRRSRLAIAALGVLPLGFHLAVERLGLEIGWFSRYMLVVALVFFVPAPALETVGRALSYPARAVASRTPILGPGAIGASALFAAGIAAWAGRAVDLPGSFGAGLALATALVAAVALALARGRAEHVASLPGAATLASLAMLFAIGHGAFPDGDHDGRGALLDASLVRYDYYRYVGGQHRLRGEAAAALAAYEHALRYAPDEDAVASTRAKMQRLRTEH